MPILPVFTDDGLLPPGDYELTLAALKDSVPVHGNVDRDTWDAAWRSALV